MTLQQPEGSEMEDAIGTFQRRLKDVRVQNFTAYVVNLDTRIF